MFVTGDAVVHPIRGAGVVEGIEMRHWRGGSELYYRIELMAQPGTKVMIPISTAEEIGLRPVTPRSKLKKVWGVLLDDPRKLPDERKDRYKLVEERLRSGNVLEIAETVRDMAWRREQRGHLSTTEGRFYERAMTLLAGEVAATQGVDLKDAEVQVGAKLRGSPWPSV